MLSGNGREAVGRIGLSFGPGSTIGVSDGSFIGPGSAGALREKIRGGGVKR